MAYETTSISELLSLLEQAGEAPPLDLVRAIYERRDEAEGPVLALFDASYNDRWHNPIDPRYSRFLHAARLLLAWRTDAALPKFARLYLDDDKQDDLEDIEAYPWVFGPAAVPYFTDIVLADTRREWHFGKSLAVSLLADIGRNYPETRDEIVALLRGLLPTPEELPELAEADPSEAFGLEWDEMWVVYIRSLAELQDEESKAHILAIFDADIVDESYLSRQDYEHIMRRGPDPSRLFDLMGTYEYLYQEHRRELSWRKKAERATAAQSNVRRATPRTTPKVGRNDPCPCGSGKKYKQCHGRPGG